jgi:hypothetical protein
MRRRSGTAGVTLREGTAFSEFDLAACAERMAGSLPPSATFHGAPATVSRLKAKSLISPRRPSACEQT